MSPNIARQPTGIPTGGQFAATAHAEPGLTLAASSTTPAAQQERLQAIKAKSTAIEKLQNDMDLLNLDAAVASVRRYFPEAAELHIDNRRDRWSGDYLDSFAPAGLRGKNGEDLTGGDPNWHYRRDAGDDNLDPGVSIHIYNLSRGFFSYPHDGVRYDSETGHRVIDLTRTYSDDDFPVDPSLEDS